MKNLLIYKASAGSGKTYALTKEYLKLAFENPRKFRNILAVTFTNKAAEEMKTRIITKLYEITVLQEKADYFEDLKAEWKIQSNSELVRISQNILNNLLHNYTFFAVSTIDSFVQRVVRSFSFEIGIQTGYQIELNTANVIDILTDKLYQKIDTTHKLFLWLIRFARFKINEGKSWDFRREIKALAYEIFKDSFSLYNKELKYIESPTDNINSIYEFITKTKKDFETKMRAISKKTHKTLNDNALNYDELGSKFKTIANYLLTKIRESKYEPTSSLLKMVDDVEKWYKKKETNDITGKIRQIYPQINACLNDAIELFETQHSEFIEVSNILKNFHSFAILNDLAALLPEYREETNSLLISDTTLILKELVEENDTPFIYEKVGTKYQNILIDEFQDTSSFQWDIFKPLVSNSIDSAFADLIVGDIKQSIYRWRGGDWKLLLKQVVNDIGKEVSNTQTLDTNWRSKKNIITFNNSIFNYAPKLIQKLFNNSIQNINDANVLDYIEKENYKTIITDAYSDSYQKVATKNTSGGTVNLSFVSVSKRSQMAKKWREHVDNKLPQLIDELIYTKNYDAKDIAILVRKNSESKHIVNLLMKHKQINSHVNYDILSPDSLTISNSSSVRILISAMKFLHNRNDSISYFTLTSEYSNLFITDAEIINNQFSANETNTILPAEFIEKYNFLKKLSLYELSEELIGIFKLNTLNNQSLYIRTFLDSILSFLQTKSNLLQDFIEWWNTDGEKISIQLSESQDAIQLMTIHKSKGLAFKVVIIPFCDWALDHNPVISPILWCKSDKNPFNQLPLIPIQYSAKLSTTAFSKDYFKENIHAYIDALNMLYVAYTRPENELHIFAPHYKPETMASIADVLFQSVQASDEKISSTKGEILPIIEHYCESSKTLEITESEIVTLSKSPISADKSILLQVLPNNKFMHKISVLHEASDFFIETDEKLADNINYGTFMHKILSKIHTIEDVEYAIRGMQFDGLITTIEGEKLEKRILEVITHPEISNWFSGVWRIKTEAAILTNEGKIRIPDRILLKEDKTLVVDFKFATESDEHIDQVNEYISLLEKMNYKNVEGYLCYCNKLKSPIKKISKV